MNREHRGVVTQYDINKESGFIKEEITGKSYFFQYNRQEQTQTSDTLKEKPLPCLHKNDLVSFRLKESENKDNDVQAFQITFIENKTIDSIIEKMSDGTKFYGRVSSAKDNYYLHDTKTSITFPLKIIAQEEKFIDFEHLNTNPVMEYTLEQQTNQPEIFARLKLSKGKAIT